MSEVEVKEWVKVKFGERTVSGSEILVDLLARGFENKLQELHEEIFSFTKEILYLLYNEKAKRVTEDCLDIRGRVNINASIYYRLCKNENGT